MSSSTLQALRSLLRPVAERLPPGWRAWLEERRQSVPPPTPRNLWLLLAAAVAIQNTAVFTSSQNAHIGVFALLVWGGALICMEDQLETLEPRPGRLGLIVGSGVILWVIARTSRILFWEGILYLLAPLAALALALLILPLRDLPKLKETLLCTWMLPAFAVLNLRLPEGGLSLWTARISGFWISLLGVPVAVEGRHVRMPVGGVTVLQGCNGLDMIAQLICVSLIFLMAFPIRSAISRTLVLIAAPSIAFLCNTLRIALLAMITTTGAGKGDWIFEFFHTETGSLIFSGFGVFLFGIVYMRLLERELPPLPPSPSTAP